MKSPSELHQDQVAYWRGVGGAHWVEEQARTDIMLAPVAELLFEHAAPKLGEAVLDLGCGCGATAITLAGQVGAAGHVTGLDVSAPMIEVAKTRSAGIANLEFICDDAATHRFVAPVADLIFSRFGVMFFGDPTAAFANIKTALRPGGRIVFACWRKFEENPWMRIPLEAAYAHVPRLPPAGPDDPGPFSFGDPGRVVRIMTGAGLRAPSFTPVNLMIDTGSGQGLDGAVHQAMNIGATSRALQDQPEDKRAAVAAAVRAALAPYAKGDRIRLPGAIWLVEVK